MEDYSLYYAYGWCIAFVVCGILSWFFSKISVRTEKNKGTLTREKTEIQVAKSGKRLKIITGVLLFYIAVDLSVTIFGTDLIKEYRDLLVFPILVGIGCLLVRYRAFVYFYSKELAVRN